MKSSDISGRVARADSDRELEIQNRRIDREFNGTLAYAVQEGNYVPEYAPFGEGDHFNVTGLFHDLDGFRPMITI